MDILLSHMSWTHDIYATYVVRPFLHGVYIDPFIYRYPSNHGSIGHQLVGRIYIYVPLQFLLPSIDHNAMLLFVRMQHPYKHVSTLLLERQRQKKNKHAPTHPYLSLYGCFADNFSYLLVMHQTDITLTDLYAYICTPFLSIFSACRPSIIRLILRTTTYVSERINFYFFLLRKSKNFVFYNDR